jgi:hypothetical protein
MNQFTSHCEELCDAAKRLRSTDADDRRYRSVNVKSLFSCNDFPRDPSQLVCKVIQGDDEAGAYYWSGIRYVRRVYGGIWRD